MRKLLTALVMVLFLAGLVVAAEVVVTKYDPDTKEVAVKDGDKEVTGKVDAKTKVSFVDKAGKETDATVDDLTKALAKAKGKKMDLTIKDGAVTEAKINK